MNDEITRAELAQLRTRVAHLEARQRSRPRLRQLRRFAPLAIVGLLVALMPLSLLAATPFDDLTGGVHDANIDAIYNAGITTGCVPNVSYCPTDLVTRQEMASFLARTAGLGTNPPVTNAAQLGGVPAANYVQTNSNLLPIAFGTVSVAGTLTSGTSNVAVSYNAALTRYEITITGESYFIADYQTVVTPISSAARSATSNSVSGKLLVKIFDAAGTAIDDNFSFVVYKP